MLPCHANFFRGVLFQQIISEARPVTRSRGARSRVCIGLPSIFSHSSVHTQRNASAVDYHCHRHDLDGHGKTTRAKICLLRGNAGTFSTLGKSAELNPSSLGTSQNDVVWYTLA